MPSDEPPIDAPLNPTLKSRTDTTYDTSRSSPAPIDTTSAHEGEGEAWPLVWLIVFILCVLIALYYIL
jgi:hypothetical protein